MLPTAKVRREIMLCSLAVREYFSDIQLENIRFSHENAELKARLKQNCTNSNQPPSASPFIKPKSLRVKTGRKPGGQPGHKGHTLSVKENPDEMIEHKVDICSHCGVDLSAETAQISQTRQVVDIKITPVVRQHAVQSKTCPVCGKKTTAAFPQGVDHYIQYGEAFRSVTVCLNQGNFIPYDRLADLSRDIFKTPISPGTLVNIVQECGASLKDSMVHIKDRLKQSKVLHVDETGTRVKGKNRWLHSTGNAQFTYLETHTKRGSAATTDIGILPEFNGTAVHDCWQPYYNYPGCQHALCNAHILRELVGIKDNYSQIWAERMKNLLLEIKQCVEEKAGALNPRMLEKFEKRYDDILELGEKANPLPRKNPAPSHKRGKQACSKVRNLLDRMRLHKADILRFMHDPQVPFDNNLAERDIRMSKVKQKISGGFRSDQGCAGFDRIRSYVATANKQRISVFEAIQAAISGRPLFTV
jgi:transposase